MRIIALDISKIMMRIFITIIVGLLIAHKRVAANDCNVTDASSIEEFSVSELSKDALKWLSDFMCNETSSACNLKITHCQQPIYYITSVFTTNCYNCTTNYTKYFICNVTITSNSSRVSVTCCLGNSSRPSDFLEADCGTSPWNDSQKNSCACEAISFKWCRNQTTQLNNDNFTLVDDYGCFRNEVSSAEDRHGVGIVVGLSVGIFLALVIVVVVALVLKSRARKKENPRVRKKAESTLRSSNVYSTVLPTLSIAIPHQEIPGGHGHGDPLQSERSKSCGDKPVELSKLGYTIVSAQVFEKEIRNDKQCYVKESPETVAIPNDTAEMITEHYSDKCDFEMRKCDHRVNVDDDVVAMSQIHISHQDDDEDDYSKLRSEQRNIKNPYNTLLMQRQDPKLRQPMSRPSINKLTPHDPTFPESENGVLNYCSTIHDNRLSRPYEHVFVIDVPLRPHTPSVTGQDDYDYPVMTFPSTSNQNNNIDDYTTPADLENIFRKSDPYSFPENHITHIKSEPSTYLGHTLDMGKSSATGISPDLRKPSERVNSVISRGKRDLERGKRDDPLYLLNKILNDEVLDETEFDYSPVNNEIII